MEVSIYSIYQNIIDEVSCDNHLAVNDASVLAKTQDLVWQDRAYKNTIQDLCDYRHSSLSLSKNAVAICDVM